MAGSFAGLPQHLDALDASVSVAGVNTYTVSHVLQLVDAGCVVEMNSALATTVTIPANAVVPFPPGTNVGLVAAGVGVVTIAAASGVTLHSAAAAVTLSAQWAGGSLYQRAANEWVLLGSLA